jgi:hypothetical protein
MTTVLVAPFNVASYPDAGGHFWVYMQTAAALVALGCEVYWLEHFNSTDAEREDAMISMFFDRMQDFGFGNKVILYKTKPDPPGYEFIDFDRRRAEQIFGRTDLLINFHYGIQPDLLSKFRRTAVVDIDPGLLQFWIANKQLSLPAHHFYFTIGETVGTSRALFPDCGLPWIPIRPGVFLDLWPYSFDESCKAFTTVSSWWGKEYVSDGKDISFENNKRVTFLEFIDLPRFTNQPVELALSFGDDEAQERDRLEHFGWRVTHAFEAAGDPRAYQKYIQQSRGEFSCVKPSCIFFQNAWISDRTLCYLASGKPAVIQDTGPSSYLPYGDGFYRFKTMDQAVDAFEQINNNYERNCRAARKIAEEYFDIRNSLEIILNTAL